MIGEQIKGVIDKTLVYDIQAFLEDKELYKLSGGEIILPDSAEEFATILLPLFEQKINQVIDKYEQRLEFLGRGIFVGAIEKMCAEVGIPENKIKELKPMISREAQAIISKGVGLGQLLIIKILLNLEEPQRTNVLNQRLESLKKAYEVDMKKALKDFDL